jgi:hypothetical protein
MARRHRRDRRNISGKVVEWKWVQLLPIARTKKSFEVWCVNKKLK